MTQRRAARYKILANVAQALIPDCPYQEAVELERLEEWWASAFEALLRTGTEYGWSKKFEIVELE